jgi:hypothetical protein
MERRFHLSNFYDGIRGNYHELGLFGTAAALLVEDSEHLFVCHPLTYGQYWIGVTEAGMAEILYREVVMTVKQAVDKFGANVSDHVRNAYDKSDYQQEIRTYHAIEPNPQLKPSLFNKPWRSVWWEDGSRKENILQVGGYHEKPFWAPRWDVIGNDAWGYGPGHDALPSMRELQLQAKRKQEAIDFLVKPEKVVANANIKMKGTPGSVVTAPGATANDVFVPYQMDVRAPAAIQEEIERCKDRINTISYADLFMAITNMAGIQPRNIEEIASRNEEKLTQLGPVIDRVNKEMLSVAIDRAFGIMMRGQFFPTPPESLRDRDIGITFTSILARMQRAVGLGQIERHAAFVGNLLAAFPDAGDNFDADEAVREYAERAGAPVRITRSKKDVDAIRQSREQAKQAEQSAAMMPMIQQGADAARLLSETDVGGKPLLDTVLGQ